MRDTNRHGSQKKSRTGRKIALGFLLAIGTIVIILAVFSIVGLFFSGSVSNEELTQNTDEFLALYNQNDMERDLPKDLAITEASCLLEEDTYTLRVTIQNTGPQPKNLQLQIYYSKEFEQDRPGTANPFVKITSDDGVVLQSGEEKTFTIKGTAGKNREELKESLSSLYFEAILGIRRGRIMLPVTITEG